MVDHRSISCCQHSTILIETVGSVLVVTNYNL